MSLFICSYTNYSHYLSAATVYPLFPFFICRYTHYSHYLCAAIPIIPIIYLQLYPIMSESLSSLFKKSCGYVGDLLVIRLWFALSFWKTSGSIKKIRSFYHFVDSFSLLFPCLYPRGNRSCCSLLRCSFFRSDLSHLLTKNDRFAFKTKDRIPNPGYVESTLYSKLTDTPSSTYKVHSLSKNWHKARNICK